MPRPHPGGVPGHIAPDGEDDHRVGLEFVGQDDGALGHFLARAGQFRLFVKIRAAAPLDALRNPVEDLDAFHRIFADRGLAAKHDRVGLFEHGVGHVGDFRARRHGAVNHAFEHVRGDDHRFADAQTGLHDLALNDGQFLVRHFDAKVATRDHDAIGFGDDFLQVFHRLLVFDFGDDERAVRPAFDDRFQLPNVLGLAHE